MSHSHGDIRVAHDARAPEVEHVTATRVRFLRGAGCCEESVARIVTAWYDDEGTLIAEIDPYPTATGENRS